MYVEQDKMELALVVLKATAIGAVDAIKTTEELPITEEARCEILQCIYDDSNGDRIAQIRKDEENMGFYVLEKPFLGEGAAILCTAESPEISIFFPLALSIDKMIVDFVAMREVFDNAEMSTYIISAITGAVARQGNRGDGMIGEGVAIV